MFNLLIRGIIICCSIVILLSGCSTTYQPTYVAEASLSTEILLGGPLNEQSSTKHLQEKPTPEKNRLKELEFDDNNNNREVAVPSGRSMRWCPLMRETKPVQEIVDNVSKNMKVSVSEDECKKVSEDEYKYKCKIDNEKEVIVSSKYIGLTNAWNFLAERGSFTEQKTIIEDLELALQIANRDLIDKQQRLTLQAYREGKLSSRQAFEQIAELESRRRNAEKVSTTRLERLKEINEQKKALYKELAKQARTLAVNQRSLTDHHLNITDSFSLDSLSYRYELYQNAFKRLRERVEKAYEEGRKDSKERRKKIEEADSPIDKLREAASAF
jgi:hypothetical protein